MPYEPDQEPELHAAQDQDARVAERQPDVLDLLRPPFGLEPFADDASLIVVEPRRVFRTIGQREQQHDAGDRRGQSLDQEEPLPARDAELAVEAEQVAGERAADDGRDRNRHHEPGDDPRAVLAGEPGGEIERDAREEAGLGGAEQQAQRVEAVGT